MLGVAWLPFCDVPYSNEETGGVWCHLFTEVNRNRPQGGASNSKLTNQELLIDARFETGAELTLEEVLLMQNGFESPQWRFDGLDNVQLIEDEAER